MEPRRIDLQQTSVDSSAPQGHQDPILEAPDLSVTGSKAQSNYENVQDSTFVRDKITSKDLKLILRQLDKDEEGFITPAGNFL